MGDENSAPGDITRLLQRWSSGDPAALDDLVEAAYRELHKIAAAYLGRERPDHTLQPTALINELFLRLAQQHEIRMDDRREFYIFAALMMRRILRDYARHGGAERRRGTRIPLNPELAWVDASGEEMIALDLALDELELLEKRKAQVIHLRFFAGCTNQETAELLGITRATVDRDLQFAKTWLYRRLKCKNDSDWAADKRR